MNVLVAGATGTLGRPLVRALLAGGHRVVGLTRSASGRKRLEAAGAGAVTADALDAAAVVKAVAEAAPTHVVHLLTALPAAGALRPRDLAATNALRTQGTANLLAAALAAGARRLVAESFVLVHGQASFDRPRDETEPLPPAPVSGPLAATVAALRALEEQLARARGAGKLETVALRYGLLYGADVPSFTELVRNLRRGLGLAPRGAPGVISLVHPDDAAAATLAALEHDAPAPVYHVVDDEPLPVNEFLALVAQAFATRPPRPVPPWLLRWLAPVVAAAAFARLPLSNRRAVDELGWRLQYPTARAALPRIAEAMRTAG